MQINSELIEYLEGLSKLKLNDGERESVTTQLQEFAQYMDTLSELDFSVLCNQQVLSDNTSALRADKVKPSKPAEDILANAPRRSGNYFTVPKTVE